jgi:hypothetical protein
MPRIAYKYQVQEGVWDGFSPSISRGSAALMTPRFQTDACRAVSEFLLFETTPFSITYIPFPIIALENEYSPPWKALLTLALHPLYYLCSLPGMKTMAPTITTVVRNSPAMSKKMIFLFVRLDLYLSA